MPIKKYGNRRLYDTTASSYVNIEGLAEVIRSGENIRVVDASSGADLTHAVLLQILLEQQGAEVLPASLLHRMIRFTVDSPMQRAALKQMGVGLDLLEKQLAAAEGQWPWMRTSPPPTPAPTTESAPEPAPEPTPEPQTVGDPELDELRARLAALEGRLKGG